MSIATAILLRIDFEMRVEGVQALISSKPKPKVKRQSSSLQECEFEEGNNE
jgi:hypothetical protein